MPRFRPLKHHSAEVWASIAAAGAAGSLLRYVISAEGGWGTIVLANVFGCAVLGVLVARGRVTPALAVGFCGGLTTFSGVCAQALAAAQGHPVGALSVDGGLVARLLPGALVLLAVNGVAGLLAFVVARRLARPAGGSHRTMPS
ncbi:MAG: CrcB family protein [Solirubrobacteraceae bacterium]|nr:CrcB family protein [Solirubrobacteraceae bacterium]